MPTIVQLRVRLAEASRQSAELRRNLGPLHPDIQVADARVREATAAISAEVERRRSSIRNDYEQALASEKVLARQINDLKNKSSDIGQSLIALRELERAVEANKKIYEEFLLRSRELSEQQGIFANASYAITPANAPSQPNGLSLPLILAIGFFAGFPLGIGLAVLRAQIEPRSGADEKEAPAIAADRPAPSLSRRAAAAQPPRPLRRDRTSERSTPISHRARCSACAFPRTPSRISPGRSRTRCRRAAARSCSSPARPAHTSAPRWRPAGLTTATMSSPLMPTPPRRGLARLAGIENKPGLFYCLHKPVDSLVRWSGRGLPHLLGARAPDPRPGQRSLRRIIVARIEELAASVDTLVLDAGDIASNAFAPALCAAAHHAIVVATPGADGVRQAHETAAFLVRVGLQIACAVTVVSEREAPAATPEPGSPLSFLRRRKRDVSAPDAAAMRRR